MTNTNPTWKKTLSADDAEALILALTSRLRDLPKNRRGPSYEAIHCIALGLSQHQGAGAITVFLTDTEKRACIAAERTLLAV
ncbi:MAG: hypothetical protein AB7U46_02780 [Paenirhodobacter sp.]|uniref:hypothetical protein n=1 Tax=Paenirhodobacter sp. TaxID=1965326 RepID=UPI003D0A436B